MVDPWKILGIAATDDERAIKKAYAARVKRAHPEDDPEAFQQLRQAYEFALGYARWHTTHREQPRKAPTAPPPSRRAPVPRSFRRDQATQVRAFESEWAKEAADQLLAKVVELHDNAEAFASEDAWKALVTHECLWNVDTRRRFERALIEFLALNEFELPPAVWCLLEQEFCFSERALELRRSLPKDGLDRVLKRLEEAPIDLAHQLYDEGQYEKLEALLKPIASGRRPGERVTLVVRTMLDRCSSARSAERLMDEVRRLRADERAWRSAPEWQALVARPELRDAGLKSLFQKRLFGYLATNGDGLTGVTWRLLDAALSWTSTYTASELAQARCLCPAIVEHVESLFAEGKHQEVVRRWAGVIDAIEGPAAMRARAILERTWLALLEQAGSLEAEGRYPEAIESVALLYFRMPGDIGKRARALVARCRLALVEHAQQLFDEGRHAALVAQIGPLVAEIDGEAGLQARLLLARSRLATGAPGDAMDGLNEVLRRAPTNVEALTLLAISYRARGLVSHASSTWERVLRLEPANQQALRELREIQEQLPIIVSEREREAQATDAETRAAAQKLTSVNPMWLFLILASLNTLRVSGATDIDPRLVTLALVVVVFGALVALWLRLEHRSEPVISLGLNRPEPEAEPQPDPSERQRTWVVRTAVSLLLIAIALATVGWLLRGDVRYH